MKPSSKEQELEMRVQSMETRLKEKIEVSCGFADPERRAQKIEEHFAQFDTDNSGQISYAEFFAGMTKLNFVGVQRELEALFNKYDDDASGTISYKEFSFHLYGMGERNQLDRNASDVIEKVKARIIESGGAGGIHAAKRILNRMDTDGSNSLDRNELRIGLRDMGVSDITDTDMSRLFRYFDKNDSGRISADELMRGLKSGMAYERKQLIREAFRRMDKDDSGKITVDDILGIYDTSCHPGVASGAMTPEDAAREMLLHFERGGDIDGVVTWEEFIDYYKGISLYIEEDSYFELMMRNAWHISSDEDNVSNTTCRRVLVNHTDGRQIVYEIKNDLGMKLNKTDISARLALQGVTGIADVKL
jgi:Ca2+-binding EF-hand superfamily protein